MAMRLPSNRASAGGAGRPRRGAPSLQQQQQQQHQQRSTAAAASRRESLLAAGAAAAGQLLAPMGAGAAQPAAAAAPKPFCAVVDTVPSWAFSTPWQEDLVDYAGGKTWFRWVNYVPPRGGGPLVALQRRYSPAAADKLPLLLVGGGPGLPCSYLESVELMAGVGRQVVFYDQVGCGNTFLASGSTSPPPGQLTPELFLGQIDALRAALGLERVHIYGQGVGGMLALSYAASRGGAAAGISSLTLASTPNSYAQLAADRRAAAQALGSADADVLLAADAGGRPDGDGAEQGAAAAAAAGAWRRYDQAYVCRYGPATAATPAGCAASAARRRSRPVFDALAGGRYFSAAGSLAGWDSAELAGALGPAAAGGGGGGSGAPLPVLVTRGQFDEVSAASSERLAAALPGARLRAFAGGSYSHIDDWEAHLTALEEHLCAAEGSEPPTATAQ